MENGKDKYRYEQVAGQEEEPLTAAGDGVARLTIVPSAAMADASAGAPPDRKFLYFAACTANLASFIGGTGLGWTSPELPKLHDSLGDNPLGRLISDAESGWIGSFLPLGAALGPFAAGIAADKLGRKKTLLIAAIPFMVAFVLNVMATSVIYFFLTRFLCGLSVGCVFTVIPMYIGEIADDEVRGALGSFLQLFVVMGLLLSYSLGPYLSIYSFNIVLLFPPALFLIIFFMFIPESPYYLIQVNNREGAEEALMKLRGRTKDAVQKEMENIKAAVEYDQANKKSFFDIFKSRGLTKALFLSVSLVVLQQVSGINIILFYAQDIFTAAGVSLAPEICTIMIGVVQVAASTATPAVVERSGKRFLLMLSSIGMLISQGVLAYYFYLKDDKKADVSSIGWIPIASLISYIITYCLGFGPLPWAVVGELFPGNIKSAASTVTASGCWLLGFLLTKYFNVVTVIIGQSGSFCFFSVCCVVAAGFVYKCLPETTGKSFEEIQEILNGKTSTTNENK